MKVFNDLLLRSDLFKLTSWIFFLYLLIFFIYALKIQNYEFASYIIFYSVTLVALNYACRNFLEKHKIPYLFSAVFLLFHLLGGVTYIEGIRLYDYFFLDLIRYDWFMHVLGGALAAVIAHDILSRFFWHKRYNAWLYFFIILVFASGLGVANELLEFFAVIFFDASKAVGDYYNNLFDLLNNAIGAILAYIIFLKR